MSCHFISLTLSSSVTSFQFFLSPWLSSVFSPRPQILLLLVFLADSSSPFFFFNTHPISPLEAAARCTLSWCQGTAYHFHLRQRAIENGEYSRRGARHALLGVSQAWTISNYTVCLNFLGLDGVGTRVQSDIRMKLFPPRVTQHLVVGVPAFQSESVGRHPSFEAQVVFCLKRDKRRQSFSEEVQNLASTQWIAFHFIYLLNNTTQRTLINISVNISQLANFQLQPFAEMFWNLHCE